LRSRPMLAAVIPLPSDEVTPPVTKTYFDTAQTSGGFSDVTRRSARGQSLAGPERRQKLP
jgi:hypothetical protein